MARLEQLVKSFVEIFEEYADGDGKLNKEEMMKMIEKEVECPDIKAKLCAAECKKGKECKGQVQFKEFSKCVCFLANCYYAEKTGRVQECDEQWE